MISTTSVSSWSKLLLTIAEKLGGCTASSMAHVLELTTPVVSGWIKGIDSKGLPTAPSPTYALILVQMARISDADLKDSFQYALELPTLAQLKGSIAGKASNRQVELESLLKDETALDYFVNAIFHHSPELSKADVQARLT